MEEIPEESFASIQERESIQTKEAEKIKKKLEGAPYIALHETGQEYTSPKFAEFLEKSSTHGEKIIFVIGGPLGLHPALLQKATKQISLSLLTFPHQMVRTILLEQIYRGVMIVKEKSYHY